MNWRHIVVLSAMMLSSCVSTANPAKNIAVGMSVADVEAVLGKPISVSGDCRKYRTNSIYTTEVRYRLDKVTSYNDGSC